MRRVVLLVPVLVSLGVLGLAGLSTYADPDRRWVGLASAGEPDALPAWWATVLYVLVALACWSRAWAEGLRWREHGPRRAALRAVAWVALGGLLTVLSADHVLGVHRLLAGDPRLTALPAPVAAHPVQALLVALGLPVVAVLLAQVPRRQRLLLVAAGSLYVVSGVLIDQRLLQPSWNHVRLETLELSIEWAGALVLVAAASSELRMPGARGGRRRPPAASGQGAGVPGAGLLDVVATVDRLRSPGGCPWDAAQTHASLAPFAVEEGHEVAEAAERGDVAALREELGDLLLQVVLHARVAAEHPADPFDLDDVARGLDAKLRRRHPHVFAATGGDGGLDAAAVEASWEDLKAAERGPRSSLDGVPAALPALQRAQEVLGRAERIDPSTVPAGTRVPAGAALGEHLLALVQAAREEGLDAEAQLRAAVRRLEERSRAREGARP